MCDARSTCHGGCACFCCLFLLFLSIPTLLFALSLPLLAAKLARVVARLIFATMTVIVVVVDVDSAIFLM